MLELVILTTAVSAIPYHKSYDSDTVTELHGPPGGWFMIRVRDRAQITINSISSRAVVVGF